MSVKAQADAPPTTSGLKELAKVFIHALILAAVVRVLFFQPFHIPSGSMKSTLLVGDYLFISRFSYGYSYHSLPYLPKLFSGRLLGSAPKRGDVAVFRVYDSDKNEEIDYIKRVIGLPGDRIQMRNGVLHINGREAKLKRIEDFVTTGVYGRKRRVAQYEETLPNGIRHRVLNLTNNSDGDNTRVYVVPDRHYFMMGDNRDNSNDSRFNAPVGFIPIENFIGRAEILYFSHKEEARFSNLWKWPEVIRWSRLFNRIR